MLTEVIRQRQPLLCAAQVDTTLSELVRDLGTKTDSIAESDLKLPMQTKIAIYGGAAAAGNPVFKLVLNARIGTAKEMKDTFNEMAEVFQAHLANFQVLQSCARSGASAAAL